MTESRRTGWSSGEPEPPEPVPERAKVNGLFFGPTIPEAHKLTAYGLWLAGGEYFDHLRNFRSKDSYVKRTLLTTSSEKTNLRKTISEALVAA